jgi:ABC-type antimicrobial peptide transport system permease subunit
MATVLGMFALLSIVLAGIGVYGVTSYNVTNRTGEFGIRMALGATRGRVTRHVMLSNAATLAFGVVAGVAGALAVGRLSGQLLFGVGPVDPLSLAVAAFSIALAALVATVVPATRAGRLNPIEALRDC